MKMEINLIAYGIAKVILNDSSKKLEVDENISIGEIKSSLIDQFPEFEKLRSLRFAVNEEYREDEFVLSPGDELVIIPPVSGG